MTGIRELFELQEIDRQIDLQTQRLGQIHRELRGNADLIAAQAELNLCLISLRETEDRRLAAEEDAGSNQFRISLLEQRMYLQGVVPRELQSISAEVAHLKERQDLLDEKALEAMDDAEAVQRVAGEQTKAVEDLGARWAGQRQRLTEEQERLRVEAAHWRTRREQHSRLLPSISVQLYDRLRASKGSIAVATAVRGACSGCRMNIPTLLVQKARAGKELVYCSSCSRLLFVA